jgi:hypothetical protein
MQWAYRAAAHNRAVCCLGSGQGFIRLDAHEGIEHGLPARDAFEHPLRQLG